MFCPGCGTNNPEGSAHCFSCGGDMNPVARLMNSFDPTKLTLEHRALAKEIGSHVDAAFRRAKEAHLMQSGEIAETETCSKQLPEGIANPPMNEMLAPERLAELFA